MKTPDSGEVGFKAGNASKKLHLFQALRLDKIATSLGVLNEGTILEQFG